MSNRAERVENARLIRDSAAFVMAPEWLRKVRAGRFQSPGFDRADWRRFADLGWFSLRLSESRGGTAFGASELCALAEQLGSGLVAGPLLPAIATAAFAPDAWLDRILEGEAVVIPAWQEERGILGNPPRAQLLEGRLTGQKRYVPMAAGADAFLVTTQQGLALVERTATGVELAVDVLQDGGHFGTVCFAAAPAIAVSGNFAEACEEITLATAAYLLGTMRKSFALTAEYLAARQQFGKAIGSFQSLQHKMVDLHLQIELASASISKAAGLLDDNATTQLRQSAVSRAKARASDAAMLVTRQAIQLHGAIGYTDDYDAGLYLRKAMVLANVHGSAAQHRARFARLQGLGERQ